MSNTKHDWAHLPLKASIKIGPVFFMRFNWLWCLGFVLFFRCCCLQPCLCRCKSLKVFALHGAFWAVWKLGENCLFYTPLKISSQDFHKWFLRFSSHGVAHALWLLPQTGRRQGQPVWREQSPRNTSKEMGALNLIRIVWKSTKKLPMAVLAHNPSIWSEEAGASKCLRLGCATWDSVSKAKNKKKYNTNNEPYKQKALQPNVVFPSKATQFGPLLFLFHLKKKKDVGGTF